MNSDSENFFVNLTLKKQKSASRKQRHRDLKVGLLDEFTNANDESDILIPDLIETEIILPETILPPENIFLPESEPHLETESDSSINEIDGINIKFILLI